MKMKLLYFMLLYSIAFLEGKKKKSEYTQKDWDRIAREWEREEMEEDERERKEEMQRNQAGIQFDPNDIGKIDPEKLLAQSKKGKPTMVFFNVKKEYCESEKQLTKITTRFATSLLNGNVQVQNYPVSANRAIFMVQDGSVSYEVKNFLLKQKEVESVTIDQQHWDADGDGTPTFPGQDKPKGKKKDESKPKLKKEGKKKEEKKANVLEDELSDQEFQEQFLKESIHNSKDKEEFLKESIKSPDAVTENDIKTEL